MNDRELLEYIAAQVGKLSQDIGGLSKDVSEVKEKQLKLENIVTRMEQSDEKTFKLYLMDTSKTMIDWTE